MAVTTVLVSCVGQKQTTVMKASELYISPWFMLAKQYCLFHGHQWFILSARHGLLDIETNIEPYNLTLKECNERYQRAWSQRVVRDIIQRIDITTSLMMFAGLRYRRFLCPLLMRHGYDIQVPMRGLGIGRQLQWLKVHGS